MKTDYIVDVRHQEPLGGRHKVVGTAWAWGNPMRMCLINDDHRHSLGWRTHEGISHIPKEWRDDNDDPVVGRGTDAGDFATFGTAAFDLRLPAFLDGKPVCAVDDTDEPIYALATLCEIDGYGRLDVPIKDFSTDSIRRALDALEWDGWTRTDEDRYGPIVDRVVMATRIRASDVPREIVQAYLDTDYVIETQKRVTLAIGKESVGLQRLYERTGRTGMAFLTAFNPEGEARNDVLNAMADAHLQQDLKDYGCPSYTGAGIGRTGSWPEERSHAVFGISLDHSIHLGRVHGQNAIVYAADDAIPKLILLR